MRGVPAAGMIEGFATLKSEVSISIFMDFIPTTNSLIASKHSIELLINEIYGISCKLSNDIFVGLNLQWPNFNLSNNYNHYLISFHTEYLHTSWIIEQAKKVYPKTVILITDFDIKPGHPWPDNIIFSQYITLAQQLKTSIKKSSIISLDCIVKPRYKVSSLSFRVSQFKKFITAYLIKNFTHEQMILSYHNMLLKIEDNHGYPTNYTVFDNLNLNRLEKTLINMSDDRDIINVSIKDNSYWKIPAYQDALVNFTNESYHYSDGIIDGKNFQHPGPYLTEKTFKPLLAGRPFVPVGQAHTVNFLQSLGLSTNFGFDLSYDSITGDLDRMVALFKTVDQINQLSIDQIYESSISAVLHNIKHIVSADLDDLCQQLNRRTVNLLTDFV